MAHMAFQSTVGSSAPQQHSRIQVQLGEWWASRWRSSSHASSSHQWRPSLSGLGDCDCRISSVHSVCRGFINRALQGVTVNGFLLGSLFFCVILNAPRGAALQEETSMQSLVQFDKKIIYTYILHTIQERTSIYMRKLACSKQVTDSLSLTGKPDSQPSWPRTRVVFYAQANALISACVIVCNWWQTALALRIPWFSHNSWWSESMNCIKCANLSSVPTGVR